jgi:hypothetical protein
MQRIVHSTLFLLTALLPLIYSPASYELFEFPKFIILLSGSGIILVSWIWYAVMSGDWSITKPAPPWVRMIHGSVSAILLTQALATMFSIHPYTSFWGYYSRFHQGLLTTFAIPCSTFPLSNGWISLVSRKL